MSFQNIQRLNAIFCFMHIQKPFSELSGNKLHVSKNVFNNQYRNELIQVDAPQQINEMAEWVFWIIDNIINKVSSE